MNVELRKALEPRFIELDRRLEDAERALSQACRRFREASDDPVERREAEALARESLTRMVEIFDQKQALFERVYGV